MLAVALVAGPVLADDSSGTIEGRVVNRTAGESGVAGLEVTLTARAADASSDTATTTTAPDGTFVFSGLATGEGFSYGLAVVFQGVEYTREALTFTAGEKTLVVELPVYETTTTDEAIYVVQAHTIIHPEQDRLVVQEYLLIANAGDRTYIGRDAPLYGDGERATLRFQLPPGASPPQQTFGLQPGAIFTTEEGFVTTGPVRPGMQEAGYTYSIALDGPVTVGLPVDYPAARYDVFVRGGGLKLRASGLAEAAPLQVEGATYLRYTASDLDRGAAVALTILGQEGGGVPVLVWWLLGAAAGVAGAAFLYLRNRRGTGLARVDSRQAALLARLAKLDDDHEAGLIADDVYERERRAAKAELARLMRRDNR